MNFVHAEKNGLNKIFYLDTFYTSFINLTERYRKVLEPPSSGMDMSRSPHIIGTAEIYSDAAGATDGQ